VAAQHNHLGYPGDALEIAGIVEGDQRISPAVRMAVYAVKASPRRSGTGRGS